MKNPQNRAALLHTLCALVADAGEEAFFDALEEAKALKRPSLVEALDALANEAELDGAPLAKACACGRLYSTESFLSLPLPASGTSRQEELELRNCPCGSTIAIEVPA